MRHGECAPHFLWSCQRKRAAPGPKEKRLCVQILPFGQVWTGRGSSEMVPRKLIVFCRVRLSPGEQRWCFPAFGGVGAAFGVVDERPVLLAPRVPLRYALPGWEIEKGRFEVGRAAAARRSRSNQVCTPDARKHFVAGAGLKVSANPGPPRKPSEAVFVGRGRASE